MLKSERQELILNRVEQYGKVVVNELTEELSVTEDTIRKTSKSFPRPDW